MMSHLSPRTTLTAVLVISSLMIVGFHQAPVAAAPITALEVTYQGEIPEGYTPEGDQAVGIDGLKGDSYDDTLWDYVYYLTGTPGPGTFWAIVCDFAPTHIVNSSGWQAWGWDDQITDSEYGGAFAGTALIGKPAIVWEYDIGGQTGPFHFQSSWAPGLRPWATYATTQTEGTTWSATPEPASMALTSLCLLGVAVWRRRRTT